MFLTDWIIKNSETIKNIALSLIPAGVLLCIFKILFNNKQIKEINEDIEKWQQKLDEEEVDSIKGIMDKIDLDSHGTRQKNKKKIEQKIQELERKKKYLLEEISVYKIFKK